MSTPIYTTLITAAELAGLRAAGAAPVIVDTRFDLADTGAGARHYAESHVTGSLYVHLDDDLCNAKTGRNGRHPLPDRAVFARTVGGLGIGPATQVVALDDQGGPYAARFWWMLKWLGHDAVAVLDGGLAAWREHGGALDSDPALPRALPRYPERPAPGGIDEAAGVAGRGAGVALLDARSPERFRGDSEPIDKVAGHIPGALNRFHRANLDDAGRFKPAAVLQREFAAVLGDRDPAEVIHSCGSGVTACHNLLAMAHAGLAGSRLYPGSWSEWSAEPSRPIARG